MTNTDHAQFTLELINDEAALCALANDWQILANSLPLQSPFISPSWNILWWQHMRADRRLIHDQLHVLIMRDQDRQLRAIAPLIVSVRGDFGTGGIKVLQFFGADPNITEIRGLICRPEDVEQALAMTRQYLRQHSTTWDWIEWKGLSQQQYDHLTSDGAKAADTRVICYLPLPADWEALKSGLSRNMKEAIRKCFNTLRRNQHQTELRVIENEPELGEAIATFLRLHKHRAAHDDGVTHADVFRDEKSQRFLSAYLQAAARDGSLRLFQLHIDGQIVATRIGFLSQGQLYLYYSGYDTSWGGFSVMTTLVIYAIRWAIEQGCVGVNLSTGIDYSKQRWQPQEIIQHGTVQVSSRMAARLRFKTYQFLRSSPLINSLKRAR
jgi:CelD/BcsL family acetyltransferase involved in cellulose biosynthesis